MLKCVSGTRKSWVSPLKNKDFKEVTGCKNRVIRYELIASKPLMMVKCHAKVDHGIGQQPKSFPGFFEPIVADAESAVGILPTKGTFHFIPFSIDCTVEPSELPGKGYRLL